MASAVDSEFISDARLAYDEFLALHCRRGCSGCARLQRVSYTV